MTFRERPLLTRRQQEIFELLVQSKSTKEIADLLFIDVNTVRVHISIVMKKIGVKGKTQAICKLVRLGKLQIDD